jgi:hypothetical protein
LFTGFYRDNVWKDSESRSGTGSNVNVTEGLRAALPELLRDLGTTTLLDLPCGDFCWMSRLDLGDINYVGADIVSEMIAELRFSASMGRCSAGSCASTQPVSRSRLQTRSSCATC